MKSKKQRFPTDVRRLIVVFGDQLAHDSAALRDMDPRRDVIWMAEVQEEATHVWCHRFRLVYFFSAMRHFRDQLVERGRKVWYHELSDDPANDLGNNFCDLLQIATDELKPDEIVMLEPGDFRVREAIEKFADQSSIDINIRVDDHFYCTINDFGKWTSGRKSLVLDHFYRHLRKRENILLDNNGDPEGGSWNYDQENRQRFPKSGPDPIPSPPRFPPDAVTKNVMDMVASRFADHPGSADAFDLPVTADQATEWLDYFLEHQLPKFGDYQDAIWHGTLELYHSRLSAALNIHLLNPRQVVDGAIAKLKDNKAPLNAVEGFVRQILGWREFIRGIYWQEMPRYQTLNSLDCDRELPEFYWTGETDMRCMADSLHQVVNYAYAHHIQRLMVMGLFAQLWGVHPLRFHEWHMAMYADAIDWVSLPNTLGMSQFGDGGIVGTKPYCATGNYIDRMSNYCGKCKYNPKLAVGENACPFTTLYWDFLARYETEFEKNGRMKFQILNLQKKDPNELKEIRQQADLLRSKWGKQ